MKSAIYLDEPPADLSRHGHLQYKDWAKHYVTVMVHHEQYPHPVAAVFTKKAVAVAIKRGLRGMVTVHEDPPQRRWAGLLGWFNGAK